MSGSVGTIKLPIVSTFDASGVTAAKAGMKDLQQAGGAGAGMPKLKPPTSATPPKLPSMPELKDAAGQLGLGAPLSELSKFLSPSTGIAAAAAGVFAAFQRGAVQAREFRIESQKLGVTTKYYRDLAWNARDAGLSLAEVTAGIEKVQSRAEAARGGDIGAQAYFASLGVSTAQLQGMSGDTGKLAQLIAQRGSGAAQIQGFGSIEAAKVAAQSGGYDTGYGRAKNDALEASNLKVQDLPGKAVDVANSFFGALSFHFQKAARAYANGNSFDEEEYQMGKEALQQQGYEALQRRNAARAEAGTKYGAGLLTTREQLRSEAAAEKDYDYHQLAALTGVSEATFHGRAQTQRMAKQQAFDEQYQTPYERMAAQNAITDRQTAEGTLTGTQGYRAAQANFAQAAQAVSGTRSKAENLRNQLAIGGGEWNDPEATADTRRDAARRMGLQIQDYTGALTSAGGLAGAADMNSVGGYSQLVGAQEQMRQSSDSRAMAEVLLQQLPAAIAQAIRENFGFEFRRPMGPMN